MIKASSLNLKIIWSKRVSFFVFLRCAYLYFEVTVRGCCCSEKKFHLLSLKWMVENWSLFLIYKSRPVTCKSSQRERKINYYSWFLSRGTSRLIKWIYRERYELLLLKRKQQLNNSLQTTELKLISCWSPFKRGISYECRKHILVHESN